MSRAGYDDARAFWDQRYAAPEYIFGKAPSAFLLSEKTRFRPGMRVLDVACGEGRNSVWLAEIGCNVTGLDLSPLALEKARILARERDVNVCFEEADLIDWSWPGEAFDAVISIFIQFAAPEGRDALFGRIVDTLRPGGLMLLQGFTPAQLRFRSGGPKEVSHLYTSEILRGLLASMEILHLREHEDDLNEGSKHVGRAALIDLIARKPD